MSFLPRRLLTSVLCISLLTIHAAASGQTHVLTPFILQQSGTLIEPVGKQQLLSIVRLDDTAPAIWLLMGPGNHSRRLGTALAQLPSVRNIAASPDNAWLAVLSEQKKQRALEIIDLQALLKTGRYVVLQQICPQKGTVLVRGWSGKKLIIASNAPLALRAPARRPPKTGKELSGLHLFAVAIDTGHIEEIHRSASHVTPKREPFPR